nr:MAG TPA: helix-turn-helix domain-containing protein [Caudoviricetes sp.]
MSKAVMLSIRPKWCEKIVNGNKTIEVRKTRPKMDTPFKCYIYCTIGGQDLNIPISQERLMRDYLETGSMKSLNCPLGNGKVIGEFTCDRIFELETKARGGSYYVKNEGQPTTNFIARQSCLDLKDMHGYLHAQKGYGWHITDLRIYDAPRELSEFTGLRDTRFGAAPYDIKRPPQSWCYVEEAKEGEKA